MGYFGLSQLQFPSRIRALTLPKALLLDLLEIDNLTRTQSFLFSSSLHAVLLLQSSKMKFSKYCTFKIHRIIFLPIFLRFPFKNVSGLGNIQNSSYYFLPIFLRFPSNWTCRASATWATGAGAFSFTRLGSWQQLIASKSKEICRLLWKKGQWEADDNDMKENLY